MKITILSLFPKIFNDFLNTSIIKKLINEKRISVEIINFRNYSKQKNKRVDDYQYGGGPGMVLMLQPIVDCLNNIKTKTSKVVLLSPQGKKFNNKIAKQYSSVDHLILIAGRYEGFDERILKFVDEVISIGDYVLFGGEIPCMVIVESVIRLVDDSINSDSLKSETFQNNLLDYPVYTKPKNYKGLKVPKILFSGSHKKINLYRYNKQLLKTKKRRIDLYNKHIKNNEN